VIIHHAITEAGAEILLEAFHAHAQEVLPEVSVRSISMTALTTRVITTLHALMDMINIHVLVRLALRVTYVKPTLVSISLVFVMSLKKIGPRLSICFT
jgi:hypothetical protein